MITDQILETIQQQKELTPEIYRLIAALAEDSCQTSGNGSHMLKNIISVLNSSYQLTAALHPELKESMSWEQMGASIQDLITFMDKTTLYRHCLKPAFRPISVNELIFQLPDEADELHPNELRNFCFDISRSQEMIVNGDRSHLLAALNEVITNCYEATQENDTITIYAHPDNAAQYVSIIISNQGTFPKTDDEHFNIAALSDAGSHDSADKTFLCQPFYSTKKNHIGIGLSIVLRVCRLHNGHVSFTQDGSICRVKIQLPLANLTSF